MNIILSCLALLASLSSFCCSTEIDASKMSREVQISLTENLRKYIKSSNYATQYAREKDATEISDKISAYYSEFISGKIPTKNLARGKDWYVDDIYKWVTAGHEIHFGEIIDLNEYFSLQRERFARSFTEPLPSPEEIDRVSKMYRGKMQSISIMMCSYLSQVRPHPFHRNLLPESVAEKASDLSFHPLQHSDNLEIYLNQYIVDCVKSVAEAEIINVIRCLSSSLHKKSELLSANLTGATMSQNDVNSYIDRELYSVQFKKHIFTRPIKHKIYEMVIYLEGVAFKP